MDAAHARRELVRGLALAYSGEWGAIRAYLGHRAALPQGPERQAIREILVDEIRHRRALLEMLVGLGGRPDPVAERKLTLVGGSIGAFCRVGGWFLPMYGAARLEADNIVEYEILARLAWWAGQTVLIPTLLHFAEVEWDHEARLRGLAASHWLWRCVPHGPLPGPREGIRARFATFLGAPGPVRRRWSLLVR